MGVTLYAHEKREKRKKQLTIKHIMQFILTTFSEKAPNKTNTFMTRYGIPLIYFPAMNQEWLVMKKT